MDKDEDKSQAIGAAVGTAFVFAFYGALYIWKRRSINQAELEAAKEVAAIQDAYRYVQRKIYKGEYDGPNAGERMMDDFEFMRIIKSNEE